MSARQARNRALKAGPAPESARRLTRREALAVGGGAVAAAALAPLAPARADEEPSADHDQTMRLWVEGLEAVQGVAVYDLPGEAMEPLSAGVMHLRGTGFPWEPHSNTYISGHRLGYPGTPSDRVFWDLDRVREGAEVVLEGPDGGLYRYRVRERFVVDPDETRVTRPVEDEPVVTLQTCTLPHFRRRLIVVAGRRRAVRAAPGSEGGALGREAP